MIPADKTTPCISWCLNITPWFITVFVGLLAVTFASSYTLGEILGKGGYGCVFAGTRKSDGLQVRFYFTIVLVNANYIVWFLVLSLQLTSVCFCISSLFSVKIHLNNCLTLCRLPLRWSQGTGQLNILSMYVLIIKFIHTSEYINLKWLLAYEISHLWHASGLAVMYYLFINNWTFIFLRMTVVLAFRWKWHSWQ